MRVVKSPMWEIPSGDAGRAGQNTAGGRCAASGRTACKAEAQDGPAQNRLERFWTARSAGPARPRPRMGQHKIAWSDFGRRGARACKAEAQDGSAQNRLERFWTARSAGPARPRPRMGQHKIAWSDFGRRGAPGLQGRGPGWAEQW